jgi:hypothetical protein
MDRSFQMLGLSSPFLRNKRSATRYLPRVAGTCPYLPLFRLFRVVVELARLRLIPGARLARLSERGALLPLLNPAWRELTILPVAR